MISDAPAGLRAAAELGLSFIHNVFTQVPRKRQRQVAAALKAIYAQESERAARAKAAPFVEQHAKTLPQAVKGPPQRPSATRSRTIRCRRGGGR